MSRKTILEQLEEEGEQHLAARGQVLAQPSAVHRQAVEVIGRLMQLGSSMAAAHKGKTPPMLRAMMSGLQASQPMLAEGIANVPPAEIKRFMALLRDDIDSILAVPDDAA